MRNSIDSCYDFPHKRVPKFSGQQQVYPNGRYLPTALCFCSKTVTLTSKACTETGGSNLGGTVAQVHEECNLFGGTGRGSSALVQFDCVTVNSDLFFIVSFNFDS